MFETITLIDNDVEQFPSRKCRTGIKKEKLCLIHKSRLEHNVTSNSNLFDFFLLKFFDKFFIS
jgi:hypothetical protein